MLLLLLLLLYPVVNVNETCTTTETKPQVETRFRLVSICGTDSIFWILKLKLCVQCSMTIERTHKYYT